MRRLLVGLSVVLLGLPALVFGSWTTIGNLGANNEITVDNQLLVTTAAALEVNNVGVCVIASDEPAGTTDGDVGQISSVTDSASNSWVKALEWCNMQINSAWDGTCNAIYYTHATSEIASGGTITINLGSDRRKAANCMEFQPSSSATVVEASGTNGFSDDAADPSSGTVATGENREHLFIRGTTCETDDIDYVADSDYTIFAAAQSDATADNGPEAASQIARGEYRIATESTSAASDPSVDISDCASIMVAFDEDGDAPAVPKMTLMGIGP